MTLSAAACLLTLAAGAARAQAPAGGAVLTGRVTTEDGTPLPGANVYITELTLSVGTGPSGVFTINVPAARVSGQSVQLRVRSVGFAPQARPVTLSAGTQTVNFQLKRDALRLTEVVVTGVSEATEQVRTPFTVQKVDSTQMPVVGTSAISQLQGKVPGANIVAATGRPGAAPVVLMRGPTSINAAGRSQQPLYIVDGIQLNGTIADINPADIESVEIVKGAAAANLYGARAGSGVINITTKSGKNSRDGVKFGLRTEGGIGDVPREFSIARRHNIAKDPSGQFYCSRSTTNGSSCTQLIDLEKEVARVNEVASPAALAPQLFLNDGGIGLTPTFGFLSGQFQVNRFNQTRNVFDDFITPNAFTNTNVDVRGRINNTGVYGSVSNLTHQGSLTYLGGYTRNAVRANIDQRWRDNLSLGIQTFFSATRSQGDNQDNGGNGFFRITRSPAFVDLKQRDALGRLYVRTNVLQQGEQNENPLYSFENANQASKGSRFLGGATLKYDPVEWATVEGNFSYDRNTGDAAQVNDLGFRSTIAGPGNVGSLGMSSGDDQSLNTSVTGTVRRAFGDLRTSLSGRYLYEQQYSTGLSVGGNNLVVPGLITAAAVTDQNSKAIGYGESIVRGQAMMGSLQLDFKDRYLLQANVRRDGSSLFGAEQRWKTFPGVSGSWIVSREPWWFAQDALSLFKLRAAYGQTGQRPSFAAQYATFAIGAGGVLTPNQLGNPDLKPEVRSETELGIDLEFFSKVGLNVSYAVNNITDQILPVPLTNASGFATQWQNAGTLRNTSFEVSLDVPWINRPNLSWSSRVIYDRVRSKITELGVAPFFQGPGPQGTETMFRFAPNELLGTIYGRDFVMNCSQLPAPFNGQCGAGQAFQKNDEGYIVWVGQGNTPGDGITKNLWRAQLPGAQAPWGNVTTGGYRLSWGMPILLRDSIGSPAVVPLGNTMPKYRFGITQNLRYKRATVYGLLDASMGQTIWNQGYHWSLGDFMTGLVDQTGKSLETAKPTGYYWRAGPGVGGNASGLGGFYDILGPNRETIEDASYMKLRELSVQYRVGRVLGAGDWTVGLIGRNLAMWTKGYRGFDPEVGIPGGSLNNAALNGVDRFTYPNQRQFTLSLSSAF
ncbi:SusC/RagA family TonB-linked outer membrane protein [Roseisolibacter sp. H3M3-2]|uniref:SusC/RagA family TonB-linked outer membrane protein n=1 Tax=Roseisolibacter sp. H3M3-2 TaxID=3031323 RepID=UPI0023DBD2DB|nr:SusC/RagA family TonB-linked outer membrane protein [Roseisolibacter sp. H3M3-2]MDF1501980.1 SusC/RagA family TonB-linked outer membrane protein [Roseisolibacter sp. H3M3-2]